MKNLESVPFDVYLILFGVVVAVLLTGASVLRWGLHRSNLSGYLFSGVFGALAGFVLATFPYLYESLEEHLFHRGEWPPFWWPASLPCLWLGHFSAFVLGSSLGFGAGCYIWHWRQKKRRPAYR